MITRIERQVVGDEQVQVPVIVDVDKDSADARAACVGHSRLCGDVLKGAVAPVVVQNAATDADNIEIDMSVVVVIGCDCRGAIARASDARFPGHILECAVAAISIKPVRLSRPTRRRMRDAFQWAGVHQVKIHQAVAVVIQPDSTSSVGLENVGDPPVAVLVDEINARLAGDVFE